MEPYGFTILLMLLKKFKEIAKDANLNLVEDLSITQTFRQVEDEVWMLTKDELFISFSLAKK